jgi:exodeoxyribonuclease VII large subunit
LNSFFPAIEVMIVGRGGGSIEDLWAFNEEVVARAIYNSKIPVISAVGHEVDFTIADFVADLRAPTPSAAAELVTSSKMEILFKVDQMVRRLISVKSKLEMAHMQVDDLVQQLVRALERKLADVSLNLEQLKGRLWGMSPQQRLSHYQTRFAGSVQSLRRLASTLFERRAWQIKTLEEKIRLLNPKTIMERGYSIVRVLKTGKVVKKTSDVQLGDKLLIELSKGWITARIS